MKKTLKIILSLVLVLAVVLGLFAFAAGGAAVMYNGSTQTIEFENALPFGSNTEPDLFTDLKNLMPGDSVTQEIKIGAKNLGIDTVKIHLRAENPNADYKTLVEDNARWVSFTVKNGEKEITGDLETGVELGTFDANKTETVSVTLSILPEAGNALQALTAEIDWIFTAEVLPGSTGGGGGFDDTPTLVDNHVNYIVGYEDGTIRPNGHITRAEVATIFYRLLTDEARGEMWSTRSIYPDVNEDDWFYVAICTLTNGGILEGYEDGTFRPNAPITRAELATIICRFDEKFGEVEATKSFEDVEGHWAEAYVEFSATRGYVEGYEDGLFHPQQNITRAETVAMVNRLLRRGVDEAGLADGHIEWPDNHKGTWYYYEMIEASDYHDFERSTRRIEGKSFNYEDWTAIKKPIAWDEMEAKWIWDSTQYRK